MRVPESMGGGGASLLHASIIATEAGRHLASAPLIEVMVGAQLLARIGGPVAGQWLDRVRTGDARVTLALHPVRRGETQLVPAGAVAHAVLCLDADALVLVASPPAMEAPANLGALAVSWQVLSQTPPNGERLTLATGSEAQSAYFAAVEEWKLLRAALLSGLGSQAVEMAAAYARERIQFGRPIGGFQAIAHPLADSATEMDGAQLLVWRAIWAIARERPDAAASVSMASWWAREASGRAVARSLRTFGGYGLSLEYDIQLYFRRAKAWALLDGDPQAELQDAADRLWGRSAVPLPVAGPVDIEFDYGATAQEFADTVRRFFRDNLTDELRTAARESGDGHSAQLHRLLAQAGLLFPDWPREFGGEERSAYEMSALAVAFEEFGWSRVPIGVTNIAGRMTMQFGCDELKSEALPRFLDGTALACLGFSEPGSGSDIFAAHTRAVRDGADWIVNGQKMFTTCAHISDYVLLLARTDPKAPKHAGLTVFLVPLNLAGVDIQPVHTVQGERTNITYYADVRVADRYRLGRVDHGNEVMAAAMAIEHGGEGYHVSQLSFLAAVLAWARQPASAQGPAPLASEDVRSRIARVAIHTEVADLLCRRAVWASTQKRGSRAYGPMSKLFSTETYRLDSADMLDLTAPASIVAQHDHLGEINRSHRHSIGTTIYGGTSEIHRSIVAEQALRLPRTRS